jgi:hypothetical protein
MLTEEGTAIVGEIREGNRAHLSALAADLGPDLERVADALALLADVIEHLRPAGDAEEATSGA